MPQITTWRPARTICQALRATLCGGSPQLADIACVRAPLAHHAPALSRFGFRAQTRGTLQVRACTSLEVRDTAGSFLSAGSERE